MQLVPVVLTLRKPSQADGRARRRKVWPVGGGVEDDVLVGAGSRLIAKQAGEPVEGGDLDRAGPRELLLHLGHGLLRQDAPVRSHDPVAVGAGRGLGIDVEGVEARHAGNGRGLVRDSNPQDVVEIRGGVGADEEHAPAPVGQRHG